MKRRMRLSISVLMLLCGCAGRVNTDLLQARIRAQAVQLSETQREIEKTRTELKQSRLEAAQLKSDLAQAEGTSDIPPKSKLQVSKVHIFPLASGGLNKDEFPGDDAVVIQFAPLDREGEPTRQPGDIEITLTDPRLPDNEGEVGRWKFSSADCRTRWTRGITSTGFQYNLPLEQSPQHSDLVVRLRYKTAEDQLYEATQAVKVVVPAGHATVQTTSSRAQPVRRRPVKVVDEPEQPLPPVGDVDLNATESGLPDWARDDEKASTSKSGAIIRHSANWTDATIPQLR